MRKEWCQKIVLSRLAIGDLATQYFADRDIFCAGRLAEDDLHRVAAATVIDEILGSCEVFEEKQVGIERFNIFNGCPLGHTATIVLRGGADHTLIVEASTVEVGRQQVYKYGLGCHSVLKLVTAEQAEEQFLKEERSVTPPIFH